MTILEKINLIDVDKTKNPTQLRNILNKIEEQSKTEPAKAELLIDGLIAKITNEKPDALKKVVFSKEQAVAKVKNLSKLKAIVPKKADIQKIKAQIKKQYPEWDDDKIQRLAQLRIDAQISRAESFNAMLDKLSKSEFYGAKELSNAPIDKGKSRNLQTDSNRTAITEADERRMTGKKYKRISKAGAKNQYGTTKGGNVYYEYRMNRRDVDNKIRLSNGGGLQGDDMGMPIKLGYTLYHSYDTFEEAKAVVEHWRKHSPEFQTIITKQDVSNRPFSVLIKSGIDVGTRIYANGGGVGGSKKYKLRAEGLNDFLAFLQEGMYMRVKSFTIQPIGVPDVVVTFETDASLSEIKSKLRKVRDSHVMLQTVKPINEYTGERNEEYADGGGVGIPNAEKMFHLPFEITIYVPSTKNVDEIISSTELSTRIEEVKKYLTETFGGFTSAEKLGGYLSSKNNVVTEKVVSVTAFATKEKFEANKSKLVNKLSVWAKKWGQEAIGLEFEGDLYYVPQKFKKGGKLIATYIPRYDIKSLTTVYGKTIKGKDLIDGAYTTRKDITRPKMARTQFEEETFEFAKGGGIEKVVVYDNGGESFDRYTVFTPDGSVFGMSENGEGFNQYIGDKTEIQKGSHLGKRLKSVPKSIENAVRNRMKKDGHFGYGGKTTNKPMKIAKYGRGTKLSSDDTPKVWIGEWSLYNEGKLIGEWVDLSEFDSGAEVMDKIQELLDKWTKETGSLREEYAVFDYENFSSSLYSEGMGESSFDKVISAYKVSKERDIPSDVLSTIMSEYDLNSVDDLEEFLDDRYIGYFENDEDLGYFLVNERGGGVENLSQDTIEMYFDYEGYGRDASINDFNEYDGYYFFNH